MTILRNANIMNIESRIYEVVAKMKVLLETMRKRRNLNQRELSERSGVPQPMISEIERGIVRNPQIGTMYKLAKALKCTIDDLIENTEQAG